MATIDVNVYYYCDWNGGEQNGASRKFHVLTTDVDMTDWKSVEDWLDKSCLTNATNNWESAGTKRQYEQRVGDRKLF